MKPIYFPFTYIPDAVAEAVAACFGQFIIYQPYCGKVPDQMQRWAEQGVLELRAPVADEDTELSAIVKGYLDWADLHLPRVGVKTADLKSRLRGLPFFDDFSSSRIIAEIKGKIRDRSTSEITDPTLTARIFLCLAQEFDRQNHEAACELDRFHQKNMDLIRQLKMEEDGLVSEPQPQPDFLADYMVADRLQAWTRLFIQDSAASGLFVTHSPAVMAHLLDKTPTAVRIMHWESIPQDIGKNPAGLAWRKKLALNLARCAEDEQGSEVDGLTANIDPPADHGAISLDVYLVPHQVPGDFFARCTELSYNAGGTDQTVKIKNTLIALIGGPGLSAARNI
jgi:hypothetical protein